MLLRIIPTPHSIYVQVNIVLHNSCSFINNHYFTAVSSVFLADWRTFSSTYSLAALTIIFALIRFLIQLFELCMLMAQSCRHLRYCKWHYNWKEFLSRTFYGIVRLLLFVFAIAFASVFNCPCSANGQWQVGALAVFLGWINAITFIKLVPRLGIYVLMFLNVIYSFLKMLILGFLLVMAFGLAFYMLFQNPSEMVCL